MNTSHLHLAVQRGPRLGPGRSKGDPPLPARTVAPHPAALRLRSPPLTITAPRPAWGRTLPAGGSPRRRRPRAPAAADGAASPPGATSDDDALGPEVLGTKFSFEDVVYTINILYFSVLLLSIFTGNRHLTSLSSFANFVTAMFLASAAFTGWSATRWLADVREHLADSRRRRDARALLRFAWSAVFWAGFCLWYAVPPAQTLAAWTGTAGAICCLYGVALAASSALVVGSWSFLGPPATPRRLITGGPYALLRHPQALGNFLAVIGFSLSSGAVVAAAAFALSFLLYAYTMVPREEAMLERTFGAKYVHYKERTPPFGWALWLLLILEAVLIGRYGLGTHAPVVTMGSATRLL